MEDALEVNLEKEEGKFRNPWYEVSGQPRVSPGYHTARLRIPCRSGLLSNAPKSNLKDDRVVVTRRLGYRKREDVTASRDHFHRVLVSTRERER